MKLPLRRPGRRSRDAAAFGTAVAGWLAGLVLVAVAGEAVVIQRVEQPTPATVPAASETPTSTTARPPARPSPASGGSPVAAPPAPAADGAAPAVDDASPTTPTTFDLGTSDPFVPTPTTAGWLPAAPVLELPPLPDELKPLLAVLSPTARQACSLTGTVVVLAALVKGDLEENGIPVSTALTYLGPILVACSVFPEDEPSICAVDAALNNALIPVDLQLLVGVPTLGALALDQALAVERVIGSTGIPVPDLASGLIRDALGCEVR